MACRRINITKDPMQLATNQSEGFAAAIARRMLSQGEFPIGREVPVERLTQLRANAGELALGFSVSRESVTQALTQQQFMAASAIEATWPGDAGMQLVARETAGKAAAAQVGQDDADEENDGQVVPRG